jgi:DNA modification methylase
VNLILFDEECLHALKQLPDDSIDALVTDPPYGLSQEPDIVEVMQHWINGDTYVHHSKGFMGKSWDSFVPGPEYWRECFRVLKPGAHGLVFAGTRTQDLMSISLRFAGFEIRETVMWLHGQGFPKSLDISKAIDKAAGVAITAPASPEAKKWAGFGTALKPAYEPIIMVRKPIAEKNVAANVLKYGTGGINIDASRVASEGKDLEKLQNEWNREWNDNSGELGKRYSQESRVSGVKPVQGRFPANLLLSHNEDCVDECTPGCAVSMLGEPARFFYTPKASKSEKNAGCEGLPERNAGVKNDSGRGFSETAPNKPILMHNHHPTVKSLKLMEYLTRMITPPGGIVLDPFMGSGSTGLAAVRLGNSFIGIEKELDYYKIAVSRITHQVEQSYQNCMITKEET